MNQSFQHIKQAINFIVSEFELTQEEACDYVVQYMVTEGNKLTVDISSLAFGTYGHDL